MAATMVKLRARDRRIEMIHRSAVKAFQNHEVQMELKAGMYRHWICSQGKSCSYYFSVYTVPGRLFVAGDIGELVVARTEDMIAWSRSAIRDVSYFAEKVPSCIKTKEYDSDVAKEWCWDMIRDIRSDKPDNWRERIRVMREFISMADESETDFCAALYGSGIVDGCDFPDLNNWNANFLWCREAVLWLLERIPE